MRKIVFFDIDGTLIDNRTQSLPDSARLAVEALRRRGHLAILNTGRPYSHIDRRILTWTWDGCVSGCGLEVRAEGQILHQDRPCHGLCRRIRDLVRECGLDVFYEVPGGLILDGTRPYGPAVAREAQHLRARGLSIALDPDKPDFCFEKFIVYELSDTKISRFREEAGRDFTLIDRGGGMIEAVLQGNSKSTGIRRILDHYRLSPADAYAFGDSTNDLPMFQCVGTPIAMGGCPQVVREAAAHVTAPVLEDGIEKGLQWCGLI